MEGDQEACSIMSAPKKRKTKSKASNDTEVANYNVFDLPRDVLLDIFSRVELPIETLVGCATLCEGSYSLFTDSRFMETLPPMSFIFLYGKRPKLSVDANCSLVVGMVVRGDEIFTAELNMNFLKKDERDYFEVVDGYDSLLIVHLKNECYTGFKVCLVNALTRECVILPEPERIANTMRFVYGMGFNPKCNKYKVVRFSYAMRKRSNTNRDGGEELSYRKGAFDYYWDLKVLTVGQDNTWRDIAVDDRLHSYSPKTFKCTATINGAIHWALDGNVILRFDLEKEEFDLVPYPVACLTVAALGVVDNSLYVGSYSSEMGIEIWILRDYGAWVWEKLPTLDALHHQEYKSRTFEMVELDRNGKMLIMFHSPMELFSYDPKRKQLARLHVHGLDNKEEMRGLVCNDLNLSSIYDKGALFKQENKRYSSMYYALRVYFSLSHVCRKLIPIVFLNNRWYYYY